ncbi:MAG: hypothetical protein ACI8TQ_001961 [Planctomycetota bacterium]
MNKSHRWAVIGAVAGLGVIWLVFFQSSDGRAPVVAEHESIVATPSTSRESGTQAASVTPSATNRAESRLVVERKKPTAQADNEISVDEEHGGARADWGDLLDGIRRASRTATPHDIAWPLVQELASVVRTEPSDEEPGAIAVELDTLLADPNGEQSFVRAAILLILGQSLSRSSSRELAMQFLDEEPGELARAAWWVLNLSGNGEPGLALHVDGFGPMYSRSDLYSWPLVVQTIADPQDLSRALSALQPALFYLASAPPNLTEAEIAQAVLTRETLVISQLGTSVGTAGHVRDQVLEWARSSDMSHACMWVLCHAALNDEELASSLGRLAVELGISTNEGVFLMELLARVGLPGVALAALNESTLAVTAGPGAFSYLAGVYTLGVLGAIIDSGDVDLAKEATDRIIEMALNVEATEDLRNFSLVELGAADSSRVIDALGPILSRGDSPPRLLSYAANIARTVPQDQHEQMKQILLNSYDVSLPQNVQQAYVRSLMKFGGDDARQFLQDVYGANTLGPEILAEVEAFLAGG